jgi:hypothetical protein
MHCNSLFIYSQFGMINIIQHNNVFVYPKQEDFSAEIKAYCECGFVNKDVHLIDIKSILDNFSIMLHVNSTIIMMAFAWMNFKNFEDLLLNIIVICIYIVIVYK